MVIMDTQKMKLQAYLILLLFTDVAVFFTPAKRLRLPLLRYLLYCGGIKQEAACMGIRKLSCLRGESVSVTSQCTSYFKWTDS